MATERRVTVWVAAQTVPMPPSPRGCSSRYRPAMRLPSERADSDIAPSISTIFLVAKPCSQNPCLMASSTSVRNSAHCRNRVGAVSSLGITSNEPRRSQNHRTARGLACSRPFLHGRISA